MIVATVRQWAVGIIGIGVGILVCFFWLGAINKWTGRKFSRKDRFLTLSDVCCNVCKRPFSKKNPHIGCGICKKCWPASA